MYDVSAIPRRLGTYSPRQTSCRHHLFWACPLEEVHIGIFRFRGLTKNRGAEGRTASAGCSELQEERDRILPKEAVTGW
ncbi:MAG: hypothetical protein PHT25_11745 [Bacteroidales bacterium]|nr:hypothetical protein [Bacteroidales bacterium]